MSRSHLERRHLLRVERPMVEFAPLIAAVRHDGGRVGWLDWAPGRDSEDDRLAETREASVLRAVTVDAGGSVAVKPRTGPPVLRDVLREHFRGCALVLIAPASIAPDSLDPSLDSIPLLEPDGDRWRVTADGHRQTFDSASLATRLRRPRPFEAPAG